MLSICARTIASISIPKWRWITMVSPKEKLQINSQSNQHYTHGLCRRLGTVAVGRCCKQVLLVRGKRCTQVLESHGELGIFLINPRLPFVFLGKPASPFSVVLSSGTWLGIEWLPWMNPSRFTSSPIIRRGTGAGIRAFLSSSTCWSEEPGLGRMLLLQDSSSLAWNQGCAFNLKDISLRKSHE